MELTERQIVKNVVFRGKIVNVRQDTAEIPGGKHALREIVEHPGGVCVLPIDEDGNAILVRQFRYAFMKEMLEAPAGKLEPGEDPAEAARRELREETGCICSGFEFMGKIAPSPGVYAEALWLYLATGLEYVGEDPDEDEFLKLEKVPLEKVREMCVSGEIEDAKTNILVFRAAEKLK